MSPWGRSKALSTAIQPPVAAVGTVDGRSGRMALDRGPDAAVKGRGDHSRILGRDAFGDRRAPCGRRRRCRSPCRSSMMSNRPAEHSDGDRSTRNAAHGPENMRFRANSRRSGAETTSHTAISHPGAPPTPSPARHTCSTPSSTSSPSPATTTMPRSAPSGTAFRRPADIREANAHPRKLRGNAAVRRWERRRVKSAGVGAGGIASARSAAERRQNTPRRDE